MAEQLLRVTLLADINEGYVEVSAGTVLDLPESLARRLSCDGTARITPSATGAIKLRPGDGLNPNSNLFGVQTVVLPTLDTPVAAGAVATVPVCDFISTISSDGDGTGNIHQDWGGMQRELCVRMADGTLFLVYIQNNAGTDRLRLMRSPTGGGSNGATWTQVATVATDMFKAILLRDRSRDHVVLVTMEGTNPDYSAKLRVYNSAGTQIGSTYTVNTAGKGIADTLDHNGFYYEAGIGRDGRVVLATMHLPQPSSLQVTQTFNCFKQIQWLFWDGANWSQEPLKKIGNPGERADYDNIVVGANGDPDQVFGVTQGNYALWESTGMYEPERLSPARIPTSYYSFDRFGVWGHNRRTGESFLKWVSPPVPWAVRPWDGDGSSYNAANDIPEARTRHAMFHYGTGEWWIPYKCIRPNPYAAGFTFTGSITGNTLTVTAITGTPLSVGTTITAHSVATTGIRATKILALGTGTGGTGTYILDTTQTIASGTVSACNPANPSTTVAATSTWRLCICTPRGEIHWDGEILNVGYGQLAITQNASGRVFLMFLALGAANANTNCHFWELTRNADGEVAANTLQSSNCLNTNDVPTGNVGFGTVTTYLGGAPTSPARSSNQGPIFPDIHHGSRPTVNLLDVIVSRRATDHNAGSVATTTNDDTQHKMDHMRIRVPV